MGNFAAETVVRRLGLQVLKTRYHGGKPYLFLWMTFENRTPLINRKLAITSRRLSKTVYVTQIFDVTEDFIIMISLDFCLCFADDVSMEEFVTTEWPVMHMSSDKINARVD